MLFLSLVKGGGFRSDEDLARHLSKLSFGFVAKLTPTGCNLASGVPSKIEGEGRDPDCLCRCVQIYFFYYYFLASCLIYTHAIDQSVGSSTGIGPDTLGWIWLAGSLE